MNESEYSERRRLLAELLYDIKAARDGVERGDTGYIIARLNYCEMHMEHLVMWLERDWVAS